MQIGLSPSPGSVGNCGFLNNWSQLNQKLGNIFNIVSVFSHLCSLRRESWWEFWNAILTDPVEASHLLAWFLFHVYIEYFQPLRFSRDESLTQGVHVHQIIITPSPQPNMYVEVRPPKTDLICMQLTNEVTCPNFHNPHWPSLQNAIEFNCVFDALWYIFVHCLSAISYRCTLLHCQCTFLGTIANQSALWKQ